MTAIVASVPDKFPGYPLDSEDVYSPSSEYSFGHPAMAHGILPYPHHHHHHHHHAAGSLDFMSGSSWDAQVEGSQQQPAQEQQQQQRFSDFSDFSDMESSPRATDSEDFSCFSSYAHQHPHPPSGQDLVAPLEDFQPMRRLLSRSSTGSSSAAKNRVSKAAPSPTAAGARGRRAGPALSDAALAQLELAAGLPPLPAPSFCSPYHHHHLHHTLHPHHDTDPHPHQPSPLMSHSLFMDSADVAAGHFCPILPSSDGLMLPCEMSPMHVDPTQITQMRLDTTAIATEPGLGSPCASWDSFSSPISRISTPVDDWVNNSGGALASPPDSQASPLLQPTKSEPGLDDELGGGYLAMMGGGGGDDMAMQAYASRRGSNNETESARDHPYYKISAPAADGLYHCPFEGDPSCNHKPEKLKCNYDKFVDSHLKPYRCKMESCGDARFSSTACLLRHEREAHAMHGHGDKPFLCTHDGCERAVPGNGFPRQWNLRDHMKRVHHTSSMPPMPAAPPAGGQSLPGAKGRRRKADGPDGAGAGIGPGRKTSVKNSAALEAAQKAARALANEWRQRHSTITDLVPSLASLEDEHAMEHIQEMRRHLDELERLCGTSRLVRSG